MTVSAIVPTNHHLLQVIGRDLNTRSAACCCITNYVSSIISPELLLVWHYSDAHIDWTILVIFTLFTRSLMACVFKDTAAYILHMLLWRCIDVLQCSSLHRYTQFKDLLSYDDRLWHMKYHFVESVQNFLFIFCIGYKLGYFVSAESIFYLILYPYHSAVSP